MQCLTLEEFDEWRATHSRRRNWKRQLTCVTPLNRLPWFSAFLADVLCPFDQAFLLLDSVVMNVPPKLDLLRVNANERRSVTEAPGHLFLADPPGLASALEAAFSGWIDFRVFFAPADHALRADHDEHTTLFSKSTGRIAKFREGLTQARIEVAEYSAEWP